MTNALCFGLPIFLGAIALALTAHRRAWWPRVPERYECPLRMDLKVLLSSDFQRGRARSAVEEAQNPSSYLPRPTVQVQVSSALPSQHWALLVRGVETARGTPDQLHVLTETLHRAIREVISSRMQRAMKLDRVELPHDLDILTVCTAVQRNPELSLSEVAGVLAEFKRRRPEAGMEELLQMVAR